MEENKFLLNENELEKINGGLFCEFVDEWREEYDEEPTDMICPKCGSKVFKLTQYGKFSGAFCEDHYHPIKEDGTVIDGYGMQ